MSSKPGVPKPPKAGDLDPLIHLWKRGLRAVRCHDKRFGATEFNPGFGGGRFHPLAVDGDRVPTLYASETIDGALSETVFHNVPVRGSARRIRRATLHPLRLSRIVPRRDLRLAQLHGHGLRRLQVLRGELIDSEAAHYPQTRRWAEALYRCDAELDGLVWVARQHDTSLAMVLFGDRVSPEDLETPGPPVPLSWGPGFERVQEVAEAVDIAIVL